jgi:tetratricopeptide (TPR) repeat protein
MTLRSPFQLQQLLFALSCCLIFGAAASAQDVLTFQDGKQQLGKVLGASASGVKLQITGGSIISFPIALIKEARLQVIPPEFAVAQKAFETKDYDKTLTALKALAGYRGLPADWAQQATAMLGDLYIEKGEISNAEAAYTDFQRLYPSAQNAPQSEVGLARLAVAKKDFATAKQKLEPITAKALEEKNVPPGLGYAYSQAFYLLGQVKESDGDFAGALENYLRTVTLFPQDHAAAALAQEKADALRKAHPEVFVP